jgi:hypothetical protein
MVFQFFGGLRTSSNQKMLNFSHYKYRLAMLLFKFVPIKNLSEHICYRTWFCHESVENGPVVIGRLVHLINLRELRIAD